MKRTHIIFLFVVILVLPAPWPPYDVYAQQSSNPNYSKGKKRKKVVKKQVAKPVVSYQSTADRQTRSEVDQAIQNVMRMAHEGQLAEASQRLFNMSRSPKFDERRMEVRYRLGVTLYEMKLYQMAAFQFIAVIRDGNNSFVKAALENLSLAADKLNDDTMLNYALSKIKLEDFPKTHQDMLKFRIGEIQMKSHLYDQAARMFASVDQNSAWWTKARYLEGLTNVERGNFNVAIQNFSDLLQAETPKGVNSVNRVAAMMALARVYYQMKNWDAAIEMYRQIPRDSELWHDSLFELSWAEMRAAQFRNVLSNFHSLHSPYYEDFYIPESLLLRSIVYLYICQYDEMEKTLDLFEKIYGPVLSNLSNFLKNYSKPLTYYDEVAVQQDNFEALKKNRDSQRQYQIPFLVARHIMQEGDYSRVRSYILAIRSEQDAIDKQPPTWKNSELGQYARHLLMGRLSNARKVAGTYVRNHVIEIRKELSDLFEQHGFARYEMLNGKKEQLKKRMAGKEIDRHIDDDNARTYYIQNGFEYWPFQGEYWLDEIGNYHYLGTQRCD